MPKWIFLAFLPGILDAQMMPPLGGVCGKMALDLNLSEAQQKQIGSICKESFKKVFDLRESVNKAEAELQGVFDESPVDQGKSNVAIDHLVAARSDLFRATSQMEVKIRTLLTDEQWQQLKMRERRGRPGPRGGPGSRPGGPDGGGWRRGGPPSKGTTTTSSQQLQK
jgi:Spy/CpxP family protein refolding chaperone